MRLGCNGRLRKFLQQLAESIGHPLAVFELAEYERLLLQSRLAFLCLGIIAEEHVQVAQRRAVVLAFLVS